MQFLHHNKKMLNKTIFSKSNYSILNYEQLIEVNGASSCSSGGGTSTPVSENASSPSNSGNLSDRGYPSSTEGYNPNAPAKEQNIKLYAVDTKGPDGMPDGYVDHFVNDIGGGKYHDPWTGETGNVSDLNLATEGLGGTRKLEYKINK